MIAPIHHNYGALTVETVQDLQMIDLVLVAAIIFATNLVLVFTSRSLTRKLIMCRWFSSNLPHVSKKSCIQTRFLSVRQTGADPLVAKTSLIICDLMRRLTYFLLGF